MFPHGAGEIEEAQQAAQADEAVPSLRGEILARTHPGQRLLQRFGRHAPPVGGPATQHDQFRDRVNVAADALEDVGHPVDDFVEQIHEHVGRRCAQRVIAVCMRGEDSEGPGIAVADRDEQIVGQDEGNGRVFRLGRVRLPHHVRRHEHGPVLAIEAARGFDLLHVLLGREGDAERPLEKSLFFPRWLVKVDPCRMRRQYGSLGRRDRLQMAIVEGKDLQHSSLPPPSSASPRW